ncbi:hypothetical protein VIA_002304 [Vibrio orientalis CIP 102891 = ATCC 33934]|uniref:Uncharacterized protein n=1 Tax=Vibrio orientalis CIP 102891 = ATCC 33934 TaxID=675816 RepID=A0ABM9YWG5_VIBOR|nr:hypothetical protein VIA_002304 [Vibrio orientalis CIP 102891 = ATCC 33934]
MRLRIGPNPQALEPNAGLLAQWFMFYPLRFTAPVGHFTAALD